MPPKRRGEYHQPHLEVAPSYDGTTETPRTLRASERVVGRRPSADPSRLHRWCADEDPLPPAA